MNIQEIRSCMPAFEETLMSGAEMEVAGIPVLAAGVCRTGKHLMFHLFSEGTDTEEQQERYRKLEQKRVRGTLTKREELLTGLELQEECVMEVIRGIRVAGKEYHVQSGNSGALADYNLEGRMLLYYFLSRNMSFGFLETRKLSGIQCTALELEGEYEKIPFSGQELADLEFLEEKRHYHVPVKRKMKRKIGRQTGRKETFTVQIPCRQEHGATAYQEREITYYINHIKLVDGWTKAKEECDEMKAQGILSDEKEYQMFLNHLKEICPPGMRNLAVEYECEDASLEFYTREQLQEKQKIREGEGATAFFLAGNRVKGEGIHGMKLRGCMIQYPVQPDITEADLELLCAFLIL
ncbi:hypothetical protein VSQ32_11925 [Lachnospiraceae bacterium KK002]